METTENKILRCTVPIFAYLFINMLVQIGVTIVVSATEFKKLGGDGLLGYLSTYNFMADLDDAVAKNGMWVSLIAGLITIPFLLNLMYRDQKAIKTLTIKQYFSTTDLKWTPAIISMAAFASLGISNFLSFLPIDNILGSYEKTENLFRDNSLILQILTLVVVAPITEEIIFRGLVYQRIKRYTNNTMVPVYVSAIAFGVYHMNLVQGLYATALGILLVFVYEKCHTIIAPIILHMSANLAALVALYLPSNLDLEHNIYLKILATIIEISGMMVVLWKMNEE